MTVSEEGVDSGFGLLSAEACRDGRCETKSWSDIVAEGGPSGRLRFVVYSGYAAVGGTVILALLLGAAGARTLKRGASGPLAPLVIAGAILGAIGALVTLYMLDQWAGRMSRLHIETSWGYSANLFFAGAALAALAGVLMMIGKPRQE